MMKHFYILILVVPLFTFGQWTQIGADIDGEAANDWSGFSVSMSVDGLTVAIGAPGNDDSGSEAGHARVYKLIAGDWTQQGEDIDGEAAGDSSGFRVSVSADGLTVAIATDFNDGNGIDAGHVRVYKLIEGVWTQQGVDIDGEAAGDLSGFAVSMSADGLTVAIGAYNNDGSGTDAGHVRVYKLIGGVWTQQGEDIDGEAAGDASGFWVSISTDGLTVAIGAPNNDGSAAEAGHVRVYKFIGGVWTQHGADIDGEAAGDLFGLSASLSADGSSLAVGGYRNDGSGNDAGHVRVFNDGLLSITSNNFGSQFKAYPNPSNGSANIVLGSIYQDVNISIFDLLGKEVMHKTYNNTDKVLIDTQQFTTGVYFVKVESNTNIASLKLVVK